MTIEKVELDWLPPPRDADHDDAREGVEDALGDAQVGGADQLQHHVDRLESRDLVERDGLVGAEIAQSLVVLARARDGDDVRAERASDLHARPTPTPPAAPEIRTRSPAAS